MSLSLVDGNGAQYGADVSVGTVDGGFYNGFNFSYCSNYTYSDSTGSLTENSCGSFLQSDTVLVGSFGN
jgi:hypothetical protein